MSPIGEYLEIEFYMLHQFEIEFYMLHQFELIYIEFTYLSLSLYEIIANWF